jgi:hypothetical protein
VGVCDNVSCAPGEGPESGWAGAGSGEGAKVGVRGVVVFSTVPLAVLLLLIGAFLASLGSAPDATEMGGVGS